MGTCPPWNFKKVPSGPGLEVAGSNDPCKVSAKACMDLGFRIWDKAKLKCQSEPGWKSFSHSFWATLVLHKLEWKRLFAGTVPANKNLFAGTSSGK